MNAEIRDLTECTEIKQTLAARPPRVLRGTLLILVALLATGTAWSAATRTDLVVQSVGRVRPAGIEQEIAPSVGGRVVEVGFKVGEEVRHGAILFRLEADRLANEIEKGRRSLRGKEEEAKRLEKLKDLLAEEVAASRAKVRLPTLEVERARREEERIGTLLRQEAVSRAELEKTEAQRLDAEERLAAARRQLEWIEKDYSVRREELELRLAAKRAEIAAEEKDIENLELERDHSIVRSPLYGVVTAGELKVGDLVEAGKSVLTIARQEGFRVDVPIASGDVGAVRVGSRARIRLEAYDYQKYGTLAGTVVSLSPDSTVQDGRVYYLARIALEGAEVARGELRGPLKFGMTGLVEIVAGRERLLAVLVGKIRHAVSLN